MALGMSRLATVLCLCIGMAACSKTQKQPANSGVPLPADFSIMFGEGGGITGVWTGYTIKADGTVETWQGRAAGENPRQSGRLTTEEVRAIWQKIQTDNFFSQELHEPGNMTTFIKVSADAREHSVAWVPALGKAAAAATSPQALLRFCRQLIEKSEQP